jgi:hypothetical protein
MTAGQHLHAFLRRNPVASIMTVIGVVLIGAVALRGENTRNIVVNSPCTTDVDGAKCQKVKKESDEARDVDSTCVLFYKVDRGGRLLRLTKCQVRGTRDQVGASLSSSEPAPAPDNEAPDRGGTVPPLAGDPLGPEGIGGKKGHAPGVPGSPSPSPSASGPGADSSTGQSPEATAPNETDATEQPTRTVPATTEAVTGAVEGTGKAVGEVAEKAGDALEDAGCKLLAGC